MSEAHLVAEAQRVLASIEDAEAHLRTVVDWLRADYSPVKAGDRIAIYAAEGATRPPTSPRAGTYKVNAVAPIVSRESPSLAWKVQLFSRSESGRFEMYRYESGWNFGPEYEWEIIKEGK